MNKHTFSYIFAFLILTSSSFAAVGNLISAKAIYNTEMAKVYSQSLTEILQIPQNHTSAMLSLEQEYQRAGDLDNLLIVREERTRFAKNPSPSAISVINSVPKLAVLQSQYIKDLKEVKALRTDRFNDLLNRYISLLTALQKDLTKSGKISEALNVAAEIKEAKSADLLRVGSRAVKNQKDRSTRSSKDATFSRRPGGELTTTVMRELMSPEVKRWNPATRRIVLKYNFTDEAQFSDWKGGSFSEDKKALLCDKTTAWLSIPFASISRIKYLTGFLDGNRARLQVGNRLFADMRKEPESECILYQSTEDYPLTSFFEKFRGDIKNTAELEFSRGKVEWKVGHRSPHKAQLTVAIPYPTRIAVGDKYSKSAYDNIEIEGVLTKKYVDYLMNAR